MTTKYNNAAFASMAKDIHELFRSQDLQNGLFDVAFNIGRSREFPSKHFNLKFIDAGTKFSENIVYLQILRKNGDLYIGNHLGDDYFLAELTAQKGFICKDCIIRIL
uniref:Uncharacterized protein n=1 Tax=Panagrolaimus sp. PS1159 TaxID=55785 RepID=A0AC35FMY7_9BILA